ncbi:unnamed protein product (macronuclear) [Paramecium tetraurelia]|uniref:Importin N-terminal domain-containing protein n=1 Tax=Paramecium tetraurelia TaxID=5888 RepID=A0BHE6_PARTE|nr:uncharacterized protein GSPATT00028998001 [Paramecium tetraurelia]CAK57963.1 unnamed protein product [Paramecium tetraurelia]|eukprot:XP_001425361.1 hypothetical protein (macronuclear) [Paramecium tetraurelia strain d4-2]
MDQNTFGLIKQIYNADQIIRISALNELKTIFRDITKIKQGFEQLLLPWEDQNLRLQYFIFLKSNITENYECSPNYIQKEIQIIIQDFMNNVDSYLLPFYCDLLNFIIEKTLPSISIIQFIISQNTYSSIHIKIITEMMNNRFIKVKILAADFLTITRTMILYYDLKDIQKLNLLADLYVSLIQPINKFDENTKSIINHQFCEILTYHCLEYELLRKFAKVVYKSNKYGLPPIEIQTMLFDILMSTYMQNENQRITDKYLAYQIMKVFKQLLSDRLIEEWKQESIIFYAMVNLIMLDYRQYENQFNRIGDDDSEDYLLIKVRQYGADFIHHVAGYFSEDTMLKQLFRLKDLINDDQQHEEFNCIKLEAHYFVICENISSIPMHMFDEKFLAEIIQILKIKESMYIPLKMQILNLLRKLLEKKAIRKQDFNIVISTLQDQFNANLITTPVYICKIVNNLIYLHSLYPSKKLITHQTFADLKTLYQLQTKLIHKENILKTLCEILRLEQGDYSVLLLIETEWNLAKQEQHLYKYQEKMILNVFEFIIEDWPINLLNTIFNGLLKMVKDCINRNHHLNQSLSVLSLLLKKYLPTYPIKYDQILADFIQIQKDFEIILLDEPDQFNQILELYYLMLLHDIADYNLTFQFLIQKTKYLQKGLQLSLLCLLCTNLKQGQLQNCIIEFYANILQSAIYDEGRAYSELICGLAILDLNQYDIKDLLMQIQEKVPNKMIFTMISNATKCIQYNMPYYLNYLISFFKTILTKQHLLFDMEYISIESNNTQNLKQYISKMKSYLIPNAFSLESQILRIFDTKYSTKLDLCQEIVRKLRIDVTKLQIQTEEQMAMENIHIS